MLRSTTEIQPECRRCFEVPTLIYKLAALQTNYQTQDMIVSAHEATVGRARSWSEARDSEIGRQYTEIEDQMLDVLELATFCSGQRENCLKQTVDEVRRTDN